MRPGNALFVPPPPNELPACLDNFEKFLHDDKTPTLIRAALAHVQFESIHPFLDGNGRLGRLLITFMLCVDGVLKEPMLYLSLYLKMRRQQYHDLLQAVRDRGDSESWVEFFLIGVIETANESVEMARQLLSLFEADRARTALNVRNGYEGALPDAASYAARSASFSRDKSRKYARSYSITMSTSLSLP